MQRLLLSVLLLFALLPGSTALADKLTLSFEADRDALCALCNPEQPQSVPEYMVPEHVVQFATYEPAPAFSVLLAEQVYAAVPPEKPPACGLGTSPSLCKPRRHWASYAIGLMAPLDAGPDGLLGTSPSAAPPLPNPEADTAGYVKSVSDAVKAGKWLVACALLVNLLVFGLRRWGAKVVPWFGEKSGGYFLATSTSLALATATQAYAGKVDLWVLLEAAGLAMTAIGQHQTGKDKAGRAS